MTARNSDNGKAQRHRRFDNANTRFPGMLSEYYLSEETYAHFHLAGGIGAFAGDRAQIVAWAKKQPAAIQDDILYFGVAAMVSRCRSRMKYGPRGVRTMNLRRSAKHSVRVQKARSFDRIVGLLDAMYVGNKLLGDCTATDLKRAAVDAQRLAGEWDVKAGFYRELAGMIGNATVREAMDRGKVVALLTTTFKQDDGAVA